MHLRIGSDFAFTLVNLLPLRYRSSFSFVLLTASVTGTYMYSTGVDVSEVRFGVHRVRVHDTFFFDLSIIWSTMAL